MLAAVIIIGARAELAGLGRGIVILAGPIFLFSLILAARYD